MVVLFECLNIRTKLNLTVPMLVERLSKHNFTRTERLRHSTHAGETVEPEHCSVNHLNNQAIRHLGERKSFEHCSRTIFDGTVVPCDLAYVLLVNTVAENGSKYSTAIPDDVAALDEIEVEFDAAEEEAAVPEDVAAAVPDDVAALDEIEVEFDEKYGPRTGAYNLGPRNLRNYGHRY
jgi:hypothetical protein